MPVSRGGPPPTTLPQAPTRSGWLGFMPVSALEDNIRSMSLEAEEAREFDEDEGTMMCSFEELPLVFSCPRHMHENTSIDLIMQVCRNPFSLWFLIRSNVADMENERENENSFGGSRYLSERWGGSTRCNKNTAMR